MSAFTKSKVGNTVHWKDSSGKSFSGAVMSFKVDYCLARVIAPGKGPEWRRASVWVVPYAAIAMTTQ